MVNAPALQAGMSRVRLPGSLPMEKTEFKVGLIDDGILELANGDYDVYVRIQDGVEHIGRFSDLEKAKEEWVQGHWGWNNTKRKKKEANIYRIVMEASYRIERVK